jgi:hypothetical protein
MMYISDDYEVLVYGQPLWQNRFAKCYTRPGEENLSGSWKKRAARVKDLIPIRNDVSHGRAVTEPDFAFLVELRTWLPDGDVDNDL